MINKFCHYCQIKGKTSRRFKFTLKKDINFNYEINVDVIYLDRKPVFHAVDAATAFQAGQFLNSMLAKDTWEALCQCWINTYFGPPNIVTYDTSTNFDSMKFRAKAKSLGIICHQISMEAHWSIGKVEKYYVPICRAYNIIQAETRGIISKNAMLQMTFKAVNNTAGPDGLVPTLLVFRAYLCIVTDFLPLAS